jgi:hypothetical protein
VAGEGAALAVAGTWGSTIVNSILAFNGPGAAILCWEGDALVLTCCDIFGNVGGDWIGCIADQYGVRGNISLDPFFCDPAAGDLGLHADSPCAPEQNPECGLIGAWGVNCGPTPTSRGTWGAIKALYRSE